MSDLDLSAIEARCAAATEAPWERWDGHAEVFAGPLRKNTPGNLSGGRGQIARCSFSEDFQAVEEDANAEFIAHARTDVPALVAEVERLTKMLADQRCAYKTRAETAEARVAELEAAAKGTLHEADLRLALEDADQDCLGCGAKLGHAEVHSDGCAIATLRSLLAKGVDS